MTMGRKIVQWLKTMIPFKPLKEEIEEDVRGQKGLPCSQIGRINSVKRGVLQISHTPLTFSTGLEETILNSHGSTKDSEWPNQNPKQKEPHGKPHDAWSTLYHRAIVTDHETEKQTQICGAEHRTQE